MAATLIRWNDITPSSQHGALSTSIVDFGYVSTQGRRNASISDSLADRQIGKWQLHRLRLDGRQCKTFVHTPLCTKKVDGSMLTSLTAGIQNRPLATWILKLKKSLNLNRKSLCSKRGYTAFGNAFCNTGLSLRASNKVGLNSPLIVTDVMSTA